LALSKETPGTPVSIRLACKVVDLDTESGTITIDTGEQFLGDFIIGADGANVRTLICSILLGYKSRTRRAYPKLLQSWTRTFVAPDVRPYPSGKSCYRWLVPDHYLADDEATREYSSRPGYMYEWITRDRRIYYYPCENHTVSNMVAFVPTSEVDHSDDSGELKSSAWPPVSTTLVLTSTGWDTHAHKDTLIKTFFQFGPGPRKVVEQAPEAEIKFGKSWRWTHCHLGPKDAWSLSEMQRIRSYHVSIQLSNPSIAPSLHWQHPWLMMMMAVARHGSRRCHGMDYP
jgi:salicylate hydroxylase